jgi:hypothetical protein
MFLLFVVEKTTKKGETSRRCDNGRELQTMDKLK